MNKKALAIILSLVVIVGITGVIIVRQNNLKDNSIEATASVEASANEQNDSLPEEDAENTEANKQTEAIEEEQLVTAEESTINDIVPTDTEETETEKTETEKTDITPLDKIMYASAEVNIRSGASTEYEKTGSLSINEEVQVTGSITGWYEVEINGTKGYVSDKYLSDSKVEIPQVTQKTEQKQQPVNNEEPSQPVDSGNSSGGIESGNLGGENGFGGVTDIGYELGIGSNTPGH